MIKWLERHKIISFILTILIAVEIFYISSLQFAGGEKYTSITSIAYHFIIFFLFSFFLFATIKRNKKINSKHILIVILISVIYSISDEVHQMFVPFRNASITDVFTDTAGIFFSVIIYSYISINSFLEK